MRDVVRPLLIPIAGSIAIAAIFIATGQDVACIAEAAVGMTVYSVDENGALLVNVCLPNLVVGTVGGGTGLIGDPKPTEERPLVDEKEVERRVGHEDTTSVNPLTAPPGR